MNPTVAAIKIQVADIIAPYLNVQLPTGRLENFHPVRLNSTKFHEEELPKIRRYYQFRYPQYPFLTEGDVREICFRHGLSFGYLPQFIGGIPKYNKLEVEVFKKNHFREEDKVDAIRYLVDYRRILKEVEILAKTNVPGIRGLIPFIEHLARTGGTRLSFMLEGGSGIDRDFYPPVITLMGWGGSNFTYLPLSDDLFLFSKQKGRVEPLPPAPSMDSWNPHAPITMERHATPDVYLGLQLPNFHVITEPVEEYEIQLSYLGMHYNVNMGDLWNRIYEENKNSTGWGGNRPPHKLMNLTENLVYIKLPSKFSFSMESTVGWGSSSLEARVDLNGLNYGIRELYSNVYERNILEHSPALKIIAPTDQFLSGLDQVDRYRLRFSPNPFGAEGWGDDPIIFQPVKYGYLMLTQWGDDVPGGSVQNPLAN